MELCHQSGDNRYAGIKNPLREEYSWYVRAMTAIRALRFTLFAKIKAKKGREILTRDGIPAASCHKRRKSNCDRDYHSEKTSTRPVDSISEGQKTTSSIYVSI